MISAAFQFLHSVSNWLIQLCGGKNIPVADWIVRPESYFQLSSICGYKNPKLKIIFVQDDFYFSKTTLSELISIFFQHNFRKEIEDDLSIYNQFGWLKLIIHLYISYVLVRISPLGCPSLPSLFLVILCLCFTFTQLDLVAKQISLKS